MIWWMHCEETGLGCPSQAIWGQHPAKAQSFVRPSWKFLCVTSYNSSVSSSVQASLASSSCWGPWWQQTSTPSTFTLLRWAWGNDVATQDTPSELSICASLPAVNHSTSFLKHSMRMISESLIWASPLLFSLLKSSLSKTRALSFLVKSGC